MNDFRTPQYSEEETRKAQQALILTTYILMFCLAVVVISSLEITLLYVPLTIITPLYLIGNYKFFYVETKG